ncbi:MAG: DUF4328 domain-containing protein [Labilithrix sp.]|nr:DUF4328 domain-containing protein [Labilithrix sp.]
MDAEHPALRLEPSVATLRLRANLTIGALALTMLVRGWDFATRMWSLGLIEQVPDTGEGAGPELMASLETADKLVEVGTVAIPLSFVLTAIAFLLWTHRLVALTRDLGAILIWRPAQAVWGFIIPFVSFVRPYQVLSAVHAALEPEKVTPPMPRVDPSAQVDYRSVAFVEPSRARHLPAALIGVWWGAFLLMSLGARLLGVGAKGAETVDAVVSMYHQAMFVSFVAVAAAALATTVVRGLTARLEERFRRIRWSSPEELAAQRISLDRE